MSERFAPFDPMCARSRTPSLDACGSLMFAWAGDLLEFAAHWFAPDVEIGVGVPQNVVSAIEAG